MSDPPRVIHARYATDAPIERSDAVPAQIRRLTSEVIRRRMASSSRSIDGAGNHESDASRDVSRMRADEFG